MDLEKRRSESSVANANAMIDAILDTEDRPNQSERRNAAQVKTTATHHTTENLFLSLNVVALLISLPKQNGQQARPVLLLPDGAAAQYLLHIIITRIQRKRKQPHHVAKFTTFTASIQKFNNRQALIPTEGGGSHLTAANLEFRLGNSCCRFNTPKPCHRLLFWGAALRLHATTIR